MGLAFGGGAVGLALLGRGAGAGSRACCWAWRTCVLGLVLGIPGPALFIMWLVTDHTVTYHNENLFLANPLTLLAVPLGLQLMWGSTKARARLRRLWWVLAALGVLGLVLKVLPPFDQDNWRLIALILPISLGMAGAFTLDRVRAPAAAAGRRRSPWLLP